MLRPSTLLIVLVLQLFQCADDTSPPVDVPLRSILVDRIHSSRMGPERRLAQDTHGYEDTHGTWSLFQFLQHTGYSWQSTWTEALSASTVLSFPAGKKLIECGDKADHFVLVLEGQIKVYETALNGREICLYRVYAGQVCVLTLTNSSCE